MTRYSKPLRLWSSVLCGVGLLWLSGVGSAQEFRTDDGNGIEILASGPVHEAFAEPVVFDPRPGLVVTKPLLELVEELPPDQRPVGDNVVWIPGYWGWDEDRDNFLWVSGFWRTLPPGREWVPGYWVEVPGGSQWVSGFWANANDDDTEYLPEPPLTLEVGPSTGSPSADHFWVPGCWYWREARYVWRPGYWTAGQSDWIWSPAHYVWTPRGCVFVGGYWDHALPRRGMLFAPVYFNSPIYSRPGYFYTPSLAVNLGVMTNHFFVGLGQRHYYFGDYYAPRYSDRGMYPWFAFSNSRFGYDPIYAHQLHQHGGSDRDWADRMRSDYEFRRDHEEARPDRVASLTPRVRGEGQRAQDEPSLVRSLTQVAAASDTQMTLQALPSNQRSELVKVAQQTREFTKQRMKTESDVTAKPELTVVPDGPPKPAETQPGQDPKPKAEGPEKNLRSTTVKRAKSPIVDVVQPETLTTTQDVNPTLPNTLKPDAKLQPNVPSQIQPVVPNVSPKVEPKLPAPDTPFVPKVGPKPPVLTPPVPKIEPPQVQPNVPKAEPPPKVQPNVPKVEPPAKVRPDVPKVEQPPRIRPDVPQTEVPPKIQPVVPNVQPPQVRPEVPKVQPPQVRPEVPKVQPPQVRPEVPKVQPPQVRPEVPRVQPPQVRPEVPKVQPPQVRPEVPKVQPPQVRPEVPKVSPPSEDRQPKVKPPKPEKEPKK